MVPNSCLAYDDVLAATDGDDISICTTEEMEKYEYLHHREFAHTHAYDVNLLERIGLDKELPIILWTIGWGKLYDEPHLGSCHTPFRENRERSLHTCAQDVQITRMATI
jgi:hypothetical protein